MGLCKTQMGFRGRPNSSLQDYRRQGLHYRRLKTDDLFIVSVGLIEIHKSQGDLRLFVRVTNSLGKDNSFTTTL